MGVTLEHVRQVNGSEDQREEQIQDILNDVRAQRAAGLQVLDENIIARHPHLAPTLADALNLLKKIQFSLRQVTTIKREVGTGDPFANRFYESETQNSTLPLITGYRLLRPIERGGQAVVFQATQESTERTVAVKVLDGGAFVTQRKQERFEREVKALVALDHPGIVRIVDRGRTADGSFFIAMDYVHGEDLDVYLERRRQEGWNARAVVELFAKIAAAIGEAHRLGIIHRDIKPSNIRVDPRHEPRILDFGLARLTATADDENPALTVTQTGGVVGSLPWASPEQASGDSAQICPASDVYSLGVVFYRALIGRSPYNITGTLRQRMQNICEAVPTIPSKTDASLPFGQIDPVLAGVILKCLEKNPARRYDDGIALAAELENYLAGRLRKFSEGVNRRRIVLMVAMVVIILGVTTNLTMSFHGSPAASVQTVKLPMIKNSIGMEMVLIPPGTFRFGSPYAEEGHNPNEEPHRVTLTHSYYIARTETTRSEYRRLMKSLPPGATAFGNDDQLPVDYVSRDQAEEFCRRLSQMEGQHYRLPTEAEWENACRAGTNTPFAGTGRIDDIAWHAGNSSGRLQPVGTKQPNNWGLYDMEGNVSEWCADQFIHDLGNRPTINPVAIFHEHSPGIVRGGSYQYSSSHSRAAARMQLNSDNHKDGTGFRVALDVPISGNSAIH